MNRKNFYRNVYYLKENCSEFVFSNKKPLILFLLSAVVAIALAICVGVNNWDVFTIINISDRTVVAIFSNGNFFDCLFKVLFHYLFFGVLILAINNFKFLSFLNYIIIGYLIFKLIINSLILISVLHLKVLLYILLCYIPFNLILILLLILLIFISKNADVCIQNKLFNYNFKPIIILMFAIILISILYIAISIFFSKFIVIIV